MCDSDSGLSLSMNESQVDIPRKRSIFVRVTSVEMALEDVYNFDPATIVLDAKLEVLKSIRKPIKDEWNFGLFIPPAKGRAGKFLLEDRLLEEYPFENSVGHLELKYKQRLYRVLKTNMNKFKKLHVKSNLRQFLDSVKSNEVSKVSTWLNRGLDPNFQWKDSGDTPLSLAIRLDKPREMILALVSGGAHLDYRSLDTRTPLHHAAARGNLEAVKVLLDLGQSPNSRDRFGMTPLYHSVLNDTPAACVERLLYDHSVIGVMDESGLQEIHQACRFGRVQHLDKLIAYGADINFQTRKNGNTPLHVCAITNQEACARLLLFRGANRTLINRSSHSPYQQAILSGNAAVAEVIKTFRNEDVVPFTGCPSRNEKRRSTPNLRFQQRCSSLNRLDDRNNNNNNHHMIDQLSVRRASKEDTFSKFNPDLNRMTSSISGFGFDTMSNHRNTRETAISLQKSLPAASGPATFSQSIHNLQSSPIHQVNDDIYPNHTATMRHGIDASRHRLLFSTLERNAKRQLPSSRPSIDPAWMIMNHQENGSDTASIFSTTSSIRGAQPSASLGSNANSALQLLLNNQANILDLDTSSLPRIIVLQKGPRGFGFVVRGRRGVPGQFEPTLEVPALQYLEKIEPSSAASRAGLKPGDYILEVNGTNVTTMSHESVVQLIRGCGEILSLKVITVDPILQVRSPSLANTNTAPNSNTNDTFNQNGYARQRDSSSIHSSTHIGPSSPNRQFAQPEFYSTISRTGVTKLDSISPVIQMTMQSRESNSFTSTINTVGTSPSPYPNEPVNIPPTSSPFTQADIPPPPPLLPLTPFKQSPFIPCEAKQESNKIIVTKEFVDSNFPLPPPPVLPDLDTGDPNNSNHVETHSNIMMAMLRRVNETTRSVPSRQESTGSKSSFDDHLREAVERRRKKMEMNSSEDECEDSRSKSDKNTSIVYSKGSNGEVQPSLMGTNTVTTVEETLTTFQRQLSISQTGESSFKVAAEKLHARALARNGTQITGTIPPPDNFKDNTKKLNTTHQLPPLGAPTHSQSKTRQDPMQYELGSMNGLKKSVSMSSSAGNQSNISNSPTNYASVYTHVHHSAPSRDQTAMSTFSNQSRSNMLTSPVGQKTLF